MSQDVAIFHLWKHPKMCTLSYLEAQYNVHCLVKDNNNNKNTNRKVNSSKTNMLKMHVTVYLKLNISSENITKLSQSFLGWFHSLNRKKQDIEKINQAFSISPPFPHYFLSQRLSLLKIWLMYTFLHLHVQTIQNKICQGILDEYFMIFIPVNGSFNHTTHNITGLPYAVFTQRDYFLLAQIDLPNFLNSSQYYIVWLGACNKGYHLPIIDGPSDSFPFTKQSSMDHLSTT